jgi:methionyl aminopeptidase
MRDAGKILGEILAELEKHIKPGITTEELDQIAEKMMTERGVKPAFKGYHGFPASICTCVNDEVVHGIPNNLPLEEGDLLTIDSGVILDGFYSDSAITVGVGKIKPEAQKLIDTATKALEKAMAIARPGIRTNALSRAIEETVRKQGFDIVKELSGHGIGVALHEDPYILNYEEEHLGPILQAGMTFAIEPIITLGSARIKTLKDGWTIVTKDGSLAVQVEHTIAITEKGAEILTKRPK